MNLKIIFFTCTAVLMILVSFNLNKESEQSVINAYTVFNNTNSPRIVHELKISKNISIRPVSLTNFDINRAPIEKLAAEQKLLITQVTKKKNKLISRKSKKNKNVSIEKTLSPVSKNPSVALTEQKVSSSKNYLKHNPKIKKFHKKYVSKKNSINITKELRQLQIKMDDMALANLENPKKLQSSKLISSSATSNDYWKTVHSIESKQGKLLYRPKNKARNCTYTLGPCGHYQLTVQALKDIGCVSLQCRKDRLNLQKSLEQSKKLLALNEKRLKKAGILNLEGHTRYLIHQQGANGIKNIIAATKGKKTLSKEIKKNMANNSPYSYKQFKRMGSQNAAKKFMQHWKHKWKKEQRLVLALASNSTDNQIITGLSPSFSDNDLNFALNMQF